jgi:hypothetical protein
MARTPLTLRRILPAVVAVAALAATPSVASAGTFAASATSCSGATFEKPFKRWLDPANYVLAPDGAVEGPLSGWTLRGGAAKVAGNETAFIHGTRDRSSLSLPRGSSATTRAMCVGVLYPTMRFMASASLGSVMAVSAVLENPLGGTLTIPVGVVAGIGSWQPTLPILVGANLLATLGNGRAAVAFTFTPVTGSWRVDDLYVDPYRQR